MHVLFCVLHIHLKWQENAWYHLDFLHLSDTKHSMVDTIYACVLGLMKQSKQCLEEAWHSVIVINVGGD